MDASPPPPAYVFSPSDIYPVGERERELCARADHMDWLYFGGLLALDVGSVYVATQSFKYVDGVGVRLLGPAAIGLTVGATVGGGYLALPKCDPHWVSYAPREGGTHSDVPLALALAMFGGVLGPIVTGIATGPLPLLWSTEERAGHLIAAGLMGFGGALLPYLLPPRTWSAAKELERIRAGADAHGAHVSYTLTF